MRRIPTPLLDPAHGSQHVTGFENALHRKVVVKPYRPLQLLACAMLLVLSVLPASAQSAVNPETAVLGSVPSGTASGEVLKLTLRDAVTMALRYNLAQIE